MGNAIDSILFQPPVPSRLKESRIIWLKTESGHNLPAFYIQYGSGCLTSKLDSVSPSSSTRRPITILYSHANAEDLGNIYPWCKYLSRTLKVNIFAYDYTGYGLATKYGPPSEKECYRDIDAAYSYLRREMGIPASHIVLYGRSLGSGPSCYLAARTSELSEDTVGGLILHAPFLSVYRIVFESGCTLVGDKFPNIDFAPSIRTPVLLVHGRKDNVVPPGHSEAIFEALPHTSHTPPLFIDSMGHNNVHLAVRAKFSEHLREYLDNYIRWNIAQSFSKRSLGSRKNSLAMKVPYLVGASHTASDDASSTDCMSEDR